MHAVMMFAKWDINIYFCGPNYAKQYYRRKCVIKSGYCYNLKLQMIVSLFSILVCIFLVFYNQHIIYNQNYYKQEKAHLKMATVTQQSPVWPPEGSTGLSLKRIKKLTVVRT